MRILITANLDFQEAAATTKCLRMKGHDVLLCGSLSSSRAPSDYRPDVVVFYGPVEASLSGQPVVQVLSSSYRGLHFGGLSVFPGESLIPEGFHGRTAVIPPAVDTELFSSRSFFQSEDKVILANGRLDPSQGHKVLMQAMTLVDPEYRTVIVGDEGDSTVQQLKNFAESLGVADRVEFPGGVTDEDLHSLLAGAAIGVVPSLGNSVATREATSIMASGVPLLAAVTDGLRGLLIDGVTGLFHSPGNWKQLAGQINHLIRNPGLSRTLTGNAREYCEKHLSFHIVGDRWTEELEQLCFQ